MGSSHGNHSEKRGPILTVLYIVAVLILVACIGFFYYLSRQQSNEYQAEKARLQSEEEAIETILTEEETEMMKSLEEALDSDLDE
ncbi:MAG: hypothetical protein LUI13_08155 [Lachnospiraceae bacterium]|nr:hypothetical protein [Lachnospiraceae bacterium]